MKDVARAAGVSQPTVSRVLRNRPNVKPEVRLRVQQAAAQLNYRPNSLVSTLMADLRIRRRSRATTTIAFITSYPTRLGWQTVTDFMDYFDGATERASALGYTLEHFWLKERGMTGPRLSSILYNRSIPAAVIAPLPISAGRLSLNWPKLTSVALGYTLQRPQINRTTNDQYQTMVLVLRKLKWLGYRRIGVIMEAFSDRRVSHRWIAGYLAFRIDFPLIAQLPPLLPSALTEEIVVPWVEANHPDVIVGSDIRILSWLGKAGYKIPEDIGFANLSVGARLSPMAGACQNSRTVGASAIDMIISQLHRNEQGIPEHPLLTLIPATWQDGPTVRDTH